MEKSKIITSNITLVAIILISMSVYTYFDYLNRVVLYDEVYSMNMVKHSFLNIIDITARDVHPPLYYWGLHVVALIFGDSMFAFRCFSALGVLATMLLGCFPIRRQFGKEVAMFFVLLLAIFPVTNYLASEIRMYSWTMFFVLATALFAYDVYKKGRWIHWLKFFVVGICAAYTHNYGLLSVFGIYLILFVAQVKSKGQWKQLLLCGLLFSVLYIPWLLQLVNQLGMISEGYWIIPLTIEDIRLFIYYLYSPKEVWHPFVLFTKYQMMFVLVIIMCIQLLLTIRVIYDQKKSKSTYLILVTFLLFFFPIAMGLIYSLVSTPVLSARYMTCSCGLYLLSIAFVSTKAYTMNRYKYMVCAFLFLLLSTSVVRFYAMGDYFERSERDYERIRHFANSDGQDIPFITTTFAYGGVVKIQYIVPGKKYYILMTKNQNEDISPFFIDKMFSDDPILSKFILTNEESKRDQPRFDCILDNLIKKGCVLEDTLRFETTHLYKITYWQDAQ